MRGPTMFSGYWRADEVNETDFRGGWFHMGDVFIRNPYGTLDFVDRVKYLIKSGGENIYPAEIERVMLQDARVADVAVVRRPDEKWGEVPVAFVARHDDTRPVSFLPLGQGLGTTKSDGGVPQSRIAEETMGILKHGWMGGAP